MSSATIPIHVAVSGHWLAGRVPRSGLRLRDLMARDNSDFFHMTDVEVYSFELEEPLVARLPEVMLKKKSILVASTCDDEHEAPVQRFYNFQPKSQAHVAVIVEDLFVEGVAHLQSTTHDIPYTIHRDGGLFFSLTQASVRSGRSKRLRFPYLLVNNELASLFAAATPAAVRPGEVGLSDAGQSGLVQSSQTSAPAPVPAH